MLQRSVSCPPRANVRRSAVDLVRLHGAWPSDDRRRLRNTPPRTCHHDRRIIADQDLLIIPPCGRRQVLGRRGAQAALLAAPCRAAVSERHDAGSSPIHHPAAVADPRLPVEVAVPRAHMSPCCFATSSGHVAFGTPPVPHGSPHLATTASHTRQVSRPPWAGTTRPRASWTQDTTTEPPHSSAAAPTADSTMRRRFVIAGRPSGTPST